MLLVQRPFMAFTCEARQVFVASPSDVLEERTAVAQAIYEWNDLHAFQMSLVLLPVRWETHAAPELGNRPQEIINKRVLKDCDLLIGIFWSRIGTHTGKAESGTVEEIEEAIKAGKQVLLYFSTKPVPQSNIDASQIARLHAFRDEYRKRGLVFDFESVDELCRLVHRHLAIKARQIQTERLGTANAAVPLPQTAFFQGHYVTSLQEALATSKESNRPLFMVIYDSKHPKRSKLDHSLGHFLEYNTTKKLVQDNFVQALIDVHSEGARQFLPADDPLEKALWVVLAPNGEILHREGVYANPDEGLKRTRGAIEAWTKKCTQP